MVFCSLNINKDHFWPLKENVGLLSLEIPYLSIIDALVYIANNTHLDLAFSISILARYSSSLTQRNWNGIKQIIFYHCGITNMRLFSS